ncbi:MAG: hypothetical protein AAGI70_05720 [Pseudomonadota bacterium]
MIELVSHMPDQPGFVGATALTLIKSRDRGDDLGNMAFRWDAQRQTYRTLPDPLRDAVEAGARSLMEQDESWTPVAHPKLDPDNPPTVIVPPPPAQFLIGEA